MRMWRWGDVRLSHQTLYALMRDGLIERVPETSTRDEREQWRTTDTLWAYVIDQARDSETVGSNVGQELLVEPSQHTTGATTSESLLTGSSTPGRQVTLAGDVVEDTDDGVDHVARNASQAQDTGCRRVSHECMPLRTWYGGRLQHTSRGEYYGPGGEEQETGAMQSGGEVHGYPELCSVHVCSLPPRPV
jgi:hypothetical protein